MTALTIKRPTPALSRVPVRWSRWSGSVNGARFGPARGVGRDPTEMGSLVRGARVACAGVM